MDDSEPPSNQKDNNHSSTFNSIALLKKQTNPQPYLRKKILLSPDKNKFKPPKGLKTDKYFQRLGILNPTVVQDENNPNLITLFPRLIYKDSKGVNSCILKQEGKLEGYDVKMFEGEETIFQAIAPHGEKGVEDFRVCKIAEEDPLHGFLVYYNGFDARTGYVRTSEKNPTNYSKWQEFGIYFPNITAKEAISLVKPDRYKKAWNKNFGKESQEKAKLEGKSVPENPFLGIKDCCAYPEKVKIQNNGNSGEYYGIIVRALPDIQIIYIKDFKELANQKLWYVFAKNISDFVLLERKYDWEQSHIGLAGAPFKLESGIFLPYHGANMNPIRDYKIGAALLDKDNPQKVLARTKKPINFTTEPWEKDGLEKGNIVFSTGNAISEGIIHEFYGAGDKYVAHCTTTESKLLEHLFN